MEELRYRQIHMDFHTSEFIKEIAEDFCAEEFAAALKEAHVDSVTCFARCHHGWLYYPSKRNPELIHPELKNHNLLLEQIDACHKNRIRVPVYTTVRWDARIMREHPDWLCIDEDGNYINLHGIPEPHFYNAICLNSGYREFFKEHLLDIIEVVGTERLDGIFMDIVIQADCCCPSCTEKMQQSHIDPNNRKEREKYAALMLKDFKQEITEFIWKQAPGIPVFYNDNRMDTTIKEARDAYSHLEIESLPSGSWGYDHFPAVVRYARTLGKDMIGMTGKFHTAWGDFHSLKNKAALEYECFQMLAMGTGCSIGDQLHPRGRLSKATYALIQDVYGSVSRKEKYCKGAKARTEIAVLSPSEFRENILADTGLPGSLIGVVHMLSELSYQFDIIDSQADMKQYPVVILPGDIPFDKELERKLLDYVQGGGSVLGACDSCLPQKATSILYGIEAAGKSEYSREFIMPNTCIGKSLPKEEFVMYGKGNDFTVIDAEVLMNRVAPYFERQGEKFCSHLHAPSSGMINGAEVVRKGKVLYCAHPIFEIYRKNAPSWCKEIFRDMLELLLPTKLLSHSGPSTLLCTLNTQDEYSRDIVHLLHYVAEKRSEEIFTIEDVIPLYHIDTQVFAGERTVSGVKLLPEETELEFRQEAGYVSFQVDKLEGHQMIGIEYSA
jgi:hypothetical protein